MGSNILLSSYVGFVFRVDLVARLVKSAILFTIYVAYVLRTAVVTKSVMLGISFSIFVIFVLQSVLSIFLSTYSVLFSRLCFFKFYFVLVTNPLVLGILESQTLDLIRNLSYTVSLTASLSTTLFSLLKSA